MTITPITFAALNSTVVLADLVEIAKDDATGLHTIYRSGAYNLIRYEKQEDRDKDFDGMKSAFIALHGDEALEGRYGVMLPAEISEVVRDDMMQLHTTYKSGIHNTIKYPDKAQRDTDFIRLRNALGGAEETADTGPAGLSKV